MKIGIFTETYHPTINGVVISIDTFRRELERRGHEYFIFTPTHQDAKAADHVYRFPAFHFRDNIVYPLALPMPLGLARHYLPEKILKELDIIHVQHFSIMGQYGLGLAKQLQIPSVYTYHTMAELYTHYLPVLREAVTEPIRTLTRYTARKATEVIVPTPSIKQYLRRIKVKKPINIVPTGIDVSLFRRVDPEYARTKYFIPADQDIIIYVGRLAEEKNIRFLLESFEQVVKSRPNTHLILVGGGLDEFTYRSYVTTHKLDRHVTLTGFLPREETIKLFGVASLFVFPSTTDTQGIVIIEAMAAGAVPVAVDALGPHDIIEDGVTGRLVSLNKKEFSGTIRQLLDDNRERQRLAKAAIHQAKYFDTSQTANLMEEIYERLTHHSSTQSHPQTASQESHHLWPRAS